MKKIIFLGLLMVMGASFAFEPPTSGPEWGVFRQTTCSGVSALSLVYDVVYMPYYVGDTCGPAYMPYAIEDLCSQICWEGGFLYYYAQAAIECDENPGTLECQAARRAFYSSAKSARNMFSATRSAHGSAARQALYANRMWFCGTDAGQVAEVMMESNMIYSECVATPADEFFYEMGMFCSMGPCGGT